MASVIALPEQFGRYRIVRKLGEGGMGAVYLAEDSLLGRQVALKVPHFDEQDDHHAVERFYREARAAAGLHHPNICPVHDVGQVEGIHYLTMPLIEGEPLSRQVGPEQPWEPARAVDLVRRLALALAVLHQKGLVHRDLKPGNIMLEPGSEPVLMDFGLARAFSGQGQRLTTTGRVVGTPAYMAPEQVMGDPDAQGPATDVYSLGVILYQLLTGCLPFDGPLMAVFGQILHADPRPPTQLRPGLNATLDALCLKALAKSPGERYGSMAEFAGAMQGWLSSGKAGPSAPSTPAPGTGVAPPRSAQSGVRVTCSTCGKHLRMPAHTGGKRVSCPGCGTILNTSAPSQAADALPAQAVETQTGPTLATGSSPQSLVPGGDTPALAPSITLPPPRPRHWLLLGSVGLVLLAGLLAGAVLLWRTGRPEGTPPTDSGSPATAEQQRREETVGAQPKSPPRPVAAGKKEAAPVLQVLEVADATVQAGSRRAIPVRIRRERCAGPVELSLEGLPEGVRAESASIGADRDEGQVDLTAESGAARASRAVRVLAVGVGVRDEGEFKLTVEAAELASEVTNSIGMKLVLIPAGKFLMGSPEYEKEREPIDEGSEQQHEVEISKPFYMGVYEVTQAEYEKVVGTNPSWFSPSGGGKDKVEGKDTSRFPVENVSWNNAVEFCKKLSEMPEEKRNGRVYRLPTEAEWEYACRGGASLKPFHFGDSLSSSQANFDGNHPYGGADKGPYLQRTTRVGSYAANAFGLYDMHGNVWEWCQDWYDKDDYKDSPRKDPKGPATGTRRVLRGGSWVSVGRGCRAACRSHVEPGDRSDNGGFRVVLVAGARTP